MRTITLTIPCLLLCLTACRTEAEIETPQHLSRNVVTIEAAVPDTKVALTPDGKGLHLAWEDGDCLRVISGSQDGRFDIKEGYTDHEAQFTGPEVSGTAFDILYPGTFSSVEEAEASDFSYQVQTGNGNTDHLRYAALLSGVDDYKQVTFSQAWAQAHGGTFRSAGAIRLVLTIPEGVTTVSGVSVDLAGRKLSLQLKDIDVSAAGQVLTAYIMTPWNDVVLPAGSEVEVTVTDPDRNVYGITIPLGAETTLIAGHVSNFTVTRNIEEYLFAGGSGSSEDPWLIANTRQLENMMNLYKNAEAPADKNSFKYWFKMIDDVDASSIAWTPLNNSGSFYKAIDFDGDGHTVSGLTPTGTYASFAGVLYGSIRNVIFDGASVNAGQKKGVVAGFLGTTGLPGSCENVIVQNSTVTGGNFSGGFAGHVRTTGSIVNCVVRNTTVTSTSGHAGGFAAYTDIAGDDKYEVPVRFVDCHVEDVTVNQEYAATTSEVYTGGFIGGANTGAGFTGCTVKAVITATKAAVKDVGGFIGRASYACPTFKDCEVLSGTKVTAMGAHAGGFIGYSEVAASYTGCSSAATVESSGEYTGGFVGYSAGASSYNECSGSGDVSGVKHTGGFAGYAENSGFTDCCYTLGTVVEKFSGKSQSGGFCGFAHTGVSFRGCYVANAVFTSTAGTYVGGFVGQLGSSYNGGNNVSATQCHVEGTAVTGSTNCGGFVGVQYDDISMSYVSGGSVTARNAHCGGFSGFVQNGDLTHCYANTTVSGGSHAQIGGMVGIAYTSSISYCYAAGSISGSGTDVAAFVGQCTRQGSNPVAEISDCIGWNASLPFCGSNSVGATLTDCYAGTEGTVSAKAVAQGWPAAVWNLTPSMPVLLDSPRRINAIFVGDSITWQWAVTSRTDDKSKILISLDPLPSYMTLSGNNVTTRFHPGFFTGNGYLDKGVSGQNTAQMLARFQKDVIDLNPVVTVIMAGTNDLAQGVTKEQIVANISAMAQMAQAAGIKVVLCSVTPCNESYSRLSDPKTKGQHIIWLNAMIKDYALSEGFSWCDYWTSLVADDGFALNPDYCLYDRLHPGPAGYDVMEPIIKPIIDNLL